MELGKSQGAPAHTTNFRPLMELGKSLGASAHTTNFRPLMELGKSLEASAHTTNFRPLMELGKHWEHQHILPTSGLSWSYVSIGSIHLTDLNLGGNVH